MKLKLVSMAAMLLIFSTSFSQGLNFGIKGGASINKITGKSFKDEFTYGYHLGGFATIGLGEKFSVQPEVLFNQFKTHSYEKTFIHYRRNCINNCSDGSM